MHRFRVDLFRFSCLSSTGVSAEVKEGFTLLTTFLDLVATVLLTQEKAGVRHAWNVFADRALPGSANEAFAWLKREAGSSVAVDSARPDRALARSRRAFAETWAASDFPAAGDSPARCSPFERLP